jgi:hypothetical protein
MIGDREFLLLISANDRATAAWSKFSQKVGQDIGKMSTAMSGFNRLAGTLLTGAFIKKTLDLAKGQEQAQAKLVAALRNVGITSQEVAQGMYDYASAMQQVTTFGDEQVIAAQAVLTAMTGVAGKGLEPATKAALDLASAMQMDVESAALLIAKSVGGMNALGRYGIQVQLAGTASEKLGQVVEAVAKKFGGFAEGEAKTATGRIKQMENALGDLGEQIGSFIAESIRPIIGELMKGLPYVAKVLATAFQVVKTIITGVVSAVVTLFSYIEKFGNFMGWWKSNVFGPAALKGEQMLLDGIADIGKIWQTVENNAEAYGQAVNDAGEGTKELYLTMKKMEAIEPVYVSDEQKKRMEDSVALAQRIADWMRTAESVQRELLAESHKAFIDRVSKQVEEVAAVTVATLDDAMLQIGLGWQMLFDSMGAGIDRMANALVSGLSDAFERIFQGANSLVEQFALGVIEAIGQIMARLAASAAVAGLLSLISGGGLAFGSTFFGLTGIQLHRGGTVPKAHDGAFINRSAGTEVPILVRGGETVRTEAQEAVLMQRLGAVSGLEKQIAGLAEAIRDSNQRPIVFENVLEGQRFLRKEMPAYEVFKSKKEVSR